MAFGITAAMLISGAATVGSAVIASSSAKSAAKSEQKASDASLAENARQYDTTRADFAPYRATGVNALQRLSQIYGLGGGTSGGGGFSGETEAAIRSRLTPTFTTAATPGTPASTGIPGLMPYDPYSSGSPLFPGAPVWNNQGREDGGYWTAPNAVQGAPGTAGTGGTLDQAGLDAAVAAEIARQGQPGSNDGLQDQIDPTKDPGYLFGMQQGQQALDRKAAASGGRVSGAALKAATEYATNYATTGYQAAYGRREDRLNRLAALAGLGQTATNNMAGYGNQSSGRAMDTINQQGSNAGNAALYQGNIWGNAINRAAANWTGQNNPTNYQSGGAGTGYSFSGYDPNYNTQQAPIPGV